MEARQGRQEEVRQGKREVEIKQERRGVNRKQEGGSSLSLSGQDVENRNGSGLQLGNSIYSSTYMRGKRMVERGKEGKTKWGICSSSSSSSAGSQNNLEESFSKENHHGYISKECKCRFREEEKAALQKLNMRHRELVDARDKKIKALQRKLEGLATFKEEFVKEERWKTEEQVRLLQEEITEMKRTRSEEMINEASRKAELEEQRRRLREAEEMLARREEEARKAAEEAARLRAERDAAVDHSKWCEVEKEKEKNINNKQWHETFQQRWEEIIDRVDKSASEGGISPEQLQQIVDKVKERFSETESFQEARTTWKEKVELLESHLEQERNELKKGIGETGELKARCDSLKVELEEAKRQLEDAKQRLEDERALRMREVAELEEEVRQEVEKRKEAKVEDFCINGCPLNVAEETEVYRAILEMVEALGRPNGVVDASENNCQETLETEGGQGALGKDRSLEGWVSSGHAMERVLQKERSTRMQMQNSSYSYSQQSTMRSGQNGKTNH